MKLRTVAALGAITLGTALTPALASASQPAIGDTSVFATVPFPGHPFGVAVDRDRVYVWTSVGDFFAGMMGNKVRLDRGMKYCEDLLAKNPKNAEALVWHGGGLLVRAVHAYTKGDDANGDKLWKTGIEEMNNAAALAPDNMKVKIGRSATLIGYAQSGWDPSDSQSRVLLESALLDYETVYRWQKPNFIRVPIHSRGELLFGLASGWSILGNDRKAREYLMLIQKECRKTPYEAEARRWLARKWPLVIQHDCIGCHVSRSG